MPQLSNLIVAVITKIQTPTSEQLKQFLFKVIATALFKFSIWIAVSSATLSFSRKVSLLQINTNRTLLPHPMRSTF